MPIGVSAGHTAVTAGTIGARVTDGDRVYALSNNHVFAAVNQGREGDHLLQPGVADGGRDPDDQLGTLAAFEPIRMCQLVCPENRIDAALALTTADDLGDSHTRRRIRHAPSAHRRGRAGHGRAEVRPHHRADGGPGDGDPRHHRRRLTGAPPPASWTRSSSPTGTFSNPGDSGSLVVTKGVLLGDRRPVGLLFAGSNLNTIANPIDFVLDALRRHRGRRGPVSGDVKAALSELNRTVLGKPGVSGTAVGRIGRRPLPARLPERRGGPQGDPGARRRGSREGRGHRIVQAVLRATTALLRRRRCRSGATAPLAASPLRRTLPSSASGQPSST